MSSRVRHVRLSDVRFAYPGATTPTLDIESLTIDAGEHVALIGSSGAGKTTLLRLIDGRLTRLVRHGRSPAASAVVQATAAAASGAPISASSFRTWL